jgi:NADH:ubiquinone oxidoreductase subunit D
VFASGSGGLLHATLSEMFANSYLVNEITLVSRMSFKNALCSSCSYALSQELFHHGAGCKTV